jgi:serine/threonine protein kinase
MFVVGDEPVPGYRLLENLGGTAFYRLWRVKAPDGASKMWKEIDLVVGNAAVETRMLGLLIKLRHPNLSTLTNFWQLNEGRTLVIETDYPEMSLRQRLEQCQQESLPGIPVAELQGYLHDAAVGLDFLNQPQHDYQGQKVAVYHRALRPECLLLFREGARLVCKVSDFGLAKPVTEQVAANSQGLLNYDYDPPEFFEGQTAPTSDQYSLAITYYELRTRSLPYPGTMLEQLQARLNDAPDLSKLSGPEYEAVRRALSRDPASRFGSCTDFVDQLSGEAVAAPAARPAEAERAAALAGARVSTVTPSQGWPPSAPVARPTPARTPAGPAPAAPMPDVRTPTPAANPARSLRQQLRQAAPAAEAPPAAPTPPPKTAPAAPAPTPSRSDLRKLRDTIGKSAPAAVEPVERGGPAVIPMKWVVVIMVVTVAIAIGVATILMPMLRPQ